MEELGLRLRPEWERATRDRLGLPPATDGAAAAQVRSALLAELLRSDVADALLPALPVDLASLAPGTVVRGRRGGD